MAWSEIEPRNGSALRTNDFHFGWIDWLLFSSKIRRENFFIAVLHFWFREFFYIRKNIWESRIQTPRPPLLRRADSLLAGYRLQRGSLPFNEIARESAGRSLQQQQLFSPKKFDAFRACLGPRELAQTDISDPLIQSGVAKDDFAFEVISRLFVAQSARHIVGHNKK